MAGLCYFVNSKRVFFTTKDPSESGGQMSTQILPAASLRSAQRLPAARTLPWAANDLICMGLWSIGRAIFRVASNFLPALRDRRARYQAASSKVRITAGPSIFTAKDGTRCFFLLLSATTAGPRRRIEPRAGAEGGRRPMMRRLRVYLAAGGL